eukprot:COSAG06_NODE_28751_length_568_cov_19.153518_1_plen_59_part_10
MSRRFLSLSLCQRLSSGAPNAPVREVLTRGVAATVLLWNGFPYVTSSAELSALCVASAA